jgi:hypothetical protein
LGDNYQPTAQVDVNGNAFTGHTDYGFFAYAGYADQTINIQGNSFTNPGGSYGIGAIARNTSIQTIDVHTNTQTGGIYYYFDADGTSNQSITY